MSVDRGPDDRVFVERGVWVVRGESFRVMLSDDGAAHYTWVSGRNPGYGFTIGGASAAMFTDQQHQNAIEVFLDEVDPETGHL